MDHSAITVRYAKAFFSTAKENDLLELLKADIQLVLDVCNNSPDFNLLLKNPIVKVSLKISIISSIFKSKVDSLTLNFLFLIAEHKRETHIPGICLKFLELTREDQNIKLAVLTTATEMSQEIVQKIGTLLEKQLNAKIELTTQVNPDIIGGAVLRIDDIQYDASVINQIKKIRENLLEAELN